MLSTAKLLTDLKTAVFPLNYLLGFRPFHFRDLDYRNTDLFLLISIMIYNNSVSFLVTCISIFLLSIHTTTYL